MRLLEGEVRAASMTTSAPEPRRITQASNFSRNRRSAAPDDTITVSMPNWRKHSASSAREVSLRSTRATRAADFLVEVGAGAVPKAFSMYGDRGSVRTRLWRGGEKMGRALRGRVGVQKCHYLRCTGECVNPIDSS